MKQVAHSANSAMPPASPTMRGSKILLLVGLLALMVASFVSLPIKWHTLLTHEALRTSVEFLDGFIPPDVSAPFLHKIAWAAAETLAISLVGTLLAAVAGLVLALPASGRVGGRYSGVARAATRTVLNALRAIPELVWASILLITAGLGPFAGTLALAAHTTGVLGRLFADAFENSPLSHEFVLRINGASSMAAFFYACRNCCPIRFIAGKITFVRRPFWGVVGAGGVEQMLKYQLSLFQMPQAATVTLVMLLLVTAVDMASFSLHRTMVRS